MLSGKNISIRRPSRKFDHKLHGPFKIVKCLSRSAVRLELPKRWRIHDVFHVSILEPYRQGTVSGRGLPDISRVLEETGDVIPSDEYLPAKIHDSGRKRRNKKLVICYWIEWEGYPEIRDYTWEPYEHLHDSVRAHQLLVKLHQEIQRSYDIPSSRTKTAMKRWKAEVIFFLRMARIWKSMEGFFLRSNTPRKGSIPYSLRDEAY